METHEYATNVKKAVKKNFIKPGKNIIRITWNKTHKCALPSTKQSEKYIN